MSELNPRNKLRQQMRRLRQALTLEQREAYAASLMDHLQRCRVFRNSQRIAFYLANDGEMDLQPLINIAWQSGKQCYLPVLGLRHTSKLWFVPYQPDSKLINNRFGILEPQHAARVRQFKARELDLVFMPLVAFDQQGNRLGMGGGFYDRTLGFLRHHRRWHHPRLIGTAYSFQHVETIQHETWDVPMHAVATEDGLLNLSNPDHE